jgi:hypothetical protein
MAAGFRRAARIAPPSPPSPISIIAQVAGSGTTSLADACERLPGKIERTSGPSLGLSTRTTNGFPVKRNVDW